MEQTTSGFTLFLIISNIILVLGLVTSWIKVIKNSKEDPRLSKGLQLLQSKISVLEDLSDRTHSQTQKLNLQLDNKSKEVKELIESLDKRGADLTLNPPTSKSEIESIKNSFSIQIQKIESEIKTLQAQLQKLSEQQQNASYTRDAALKDSSIHNPQAQDSKPTKNEYATNEKYLLAAEMIRQGHTALDIVKQLNLTVGEVQFISKLQIESSHLTTNANHQHLNHSAASFGSQIQKHLSIQTQDMNKSQLQISDTTTARPMQRAQPITKKSESVSVVKTNEIRPYIFKRME